MATARTWSRPEILTLAAAKAPEPIRVSWHWRNDQMRKLCNRLVRAGKLRRVPKPTRGDGADFYALPAITDPAAPRAGTGCPDE